MNCTACPYQKQIDALRRRCLACNPESDGGTPHGRVKADEFTLNSVPKAVDFDRSPSSMATNLSSADEHKLRIAMSAMFGLDPIPFMMLWHLMRGGKLADFGKTIEAFRSYRGNSKQAAEYYKRKLIDAFPSIRSVITNKSENDASSRIIETLS